MYGKYFVISFAVPCKEFGSLTGQARQAASSLFPPSLSLSLPLSLLVVQADSIVASFWWLVIK